MSGELSAASPGAVFVQLGRDVRTGTYQLTFRGTWGSSTQSATATLVVTKRAQPLSLSRLLGSHSAWNLLTARR
jgi:hypothetical protein